MTVDIPADLLRQAEAAAAERGQRLPDLINEALRQTLTKQPPLPKKLPDGKRKKSPVASNSNLPKWLREWEQWSREIARSRKSNGSAVELLSNMRR